MASATSNSGAGPCREQPSGGVAALAFAVLLAVNCPARAVETNEAAQAALRVVQRAEEQQKSRPQDQKSAWELARACFDLCDFATNNTERASLSERGIAASRNALVQNSNCAPAHYYLGLNLGQLARTRSLGALKLVDQMERALTRASELDAHFDYAGADRSLGMLYRDAPAFISVGSRSKARQHLELSMALAPDYPENRLVLIETELKWGERNRARAHLKALQDIWPKARTELSGAEWAAAWTDWESRRQDVARRLEEPAKLESPRH